MRAFQIGFVAMAALLAASVLGCASDGGDTGMKSGAPSGTTTIGWDQIRRGMTPDEVIKALDLPQDSRITMVNTYWYYSNKGAQGPYVKFGTRDMTVETWNRGEK